MFFDGKPQVPGLYSAFAEKLFALCPDAGIRVRNLRENDAATPAPLLQNCRPYKIDQKTKSHTEHCGKQNGNTYPFPASALFTDG